MPTYQYRYEKCGEVFEHVTEHQTAHPRCPKRRKRSRTAGLAGIFRKDFQE